MNFSPAELLPHTAPMVLLDTVTGFTDHSVSALVRVHAGARFCDPAHGVPAHAGLEWMAQCCGLFAGLEAKAAGKDVQVGFLLGTRRYRAARPYFALGETFGVTAGLTFREGGMAVFDCTIADSAGIEAASARLTVFQPGENDVG